ncbi:MAG: hypothetical protein D6752_00710 [Candidatus Nitrosothermus koennekii]|nr:MAG: hypothetical protein D6752_00710 [Candidatus Nitrosothermus koennekii]
MQINKRYTILASILAIALITTTAAFSQQEYAEHQLQTSSPYIPHHGKTILIHITSGEADDPHQVHKATMGADHALAWHRSGMNVVIFLDAEGVLIGAEEVPEELSRANGDLIKFLSEGGRVIACSHCVQMHGLTPDDMLPSIEIDTHPTMSRVQDILRSGATVLDY